MSEFVSGVLKELGAAGAAISVLMTTIGVLGGAIVVLDRRNKSSADATNKARMAEREIMIKMLEASNTAINRSSEASEQRNEVTQQLADAIKSQATVFAIVNERVSLYHADNKEKLKDVSDVVGAMADALRVNTGVVTEVRNQNIAVADRLSGVAEKLNRRRS
jgi:hypothetical protein